MFQFLVKIGSDKNIFGCRAPKRRNEGVIVDYSTDNGITWNVLRVLDPAFLRKQPQTVDVLIPAQAKGPGTILRWWQPLGDLGTK